MSNNFHRTSLLKNSWIGNFWLWEKDFKKKNWRDVAVPESVQSCFELSIYLSLKRTSRELLLKITRGEKIQGNVLESSKHDWTLSCTATSLQFFS